MIPEAELEETDAGLVPASTGWFVMSAREARWFHRPGRDSLPLTGSDEFEARTLTASASRPPRASRDVQRVGDTSRI